MLDPSKIFKQQPLRYLELYNLIVGMNEKTKKEENKKRKG